MKSLYSLIVLFFFVICWYFIRRNKMQLINKRVSTGRRVLLSYTNSLMKDPEKNIKISTWDTEEELRQKADIHRSRLEKFGRSMINGKMLFLGPKGGVYSYTSGGRKKYV